MKKKYADRFSVKVETVDNPITKEEYIFSDVFKGINAKVDLSPLHEKEVGIIYRVYFEVIKDDNSTSKNILYCGTNISEARQAFYKSSISDNSTPTKFLTSTKTIAEKLIPPPSDNAPMQVIQLNW